MNIMTAEELEAWALEYDHSARYWRDECEGTDNDSRLEIYKAREMLALKKAKFLRMPRGCMRCDVQGVQGMNEVRGAQGPEEMALYNMIRKIVR